MALTVTQAQPTQTISGVTQANPGTISGVSQAPTQTITGTSSAPIAGATNLNPQTSSTAPIQGSQVNPQPASTAPIQGTAPNLQPTVNPQTGQTFTLMDGSKYDASGNLVSEPTSTPAPPPPSTAQTAFNQLQASGTPPPQDSSAGISGATTATKNATPPPAFDTSKIESTLANDPGYQKLVADAKNIQAVGTQSETLTQQYQDLLNQYNIPGINTELLNDKKIIDGTEDDIRAEVTAAGGFATNSQVLGLATARNKTLIANYNNLLDQKNQLMQQITTMSGLQEKDRANALQVANNQLQIDTQLADYAQKFQANAQQAYNNVISAVGYAGLYQALTATGDPNAVTLAEQTLGLQPGELQGLATQTNSAAQVDLQLKQTQLAQAQLNLQQDQASAPLDAAIKKAQLASSQESTAKTAYDLNYQKTHNGMTPSEVAAADQKVIDDANTQIQKMQLNAANLIGQMVQGQVNWNTAWNQLHAEFPEASVNTIDNALNATQYRSKYGG